MSIRPQKITDKPDPINEKAVGVILTRQEIKSLFAGKTLRLPNIPTEDKKTVIVMLRRGKRS